jgi:peptidoglycan/xylan/chitin deacetylase (PgdA/CDA1 family)
VGGLNVRAILTYHSIDDSGSVISIAPEIFEEHVRWLLHERIRVVSLDRLLQDTSEDLGHSVAITFDDGFANFLSVAPLLLDHALPATIFAVSNHVGGDNRWHGQRDPAVPALPLLGWEDLRRLVDRGVTIGAHTRTHARLTALPSARLHEEIGGCVEDLETRLGIRVQYLAYPYGEVNDRVAEVAAARCAGAVTTEFRVLAPGDSRARLPRLDMYYFRKAGALRDWGTARFSQRLRWIRTKRRVRQAFA